MFLGGIFLSDTRETVEMITHGAKSDLEQDLPWLCGKLVPILERLELLSEVCCSSFFYRKSHTVYTALVSIK